MKRNIRLTAIALFAEGANEEAVHAFMEQIAADEKGAEFKTIFRNTILSDGSRRSYAKLSKVMGQDHLEIEWIVDMTKKFFDAGHQDVAWRVTTINTEDENGENTTTSFPAELFRDSLEEDV